jgi:hypothetical protein
LAAKAEGEEDVVADFELEDEVFKALAPHEDPDVLVRSLPKMMLHGRRICPSASCAGYNVKDTGRRFHLQVLCKVKDCL